MSVLVLLAIALVLGRTSLVRQSIGRDLEAQAFSQRLLLVTSGMEVAYHGQDRGFVQRLMPPETASGVVALANQPVELGRGGSRLLGAGFVTRGIDPEGSLVPVVRTDVVKYKVRFGDTLSGIAEKFGITARTLWSNNDLRNPDLLSVGQELVVPPVDGLIYKVRKGDTLAAVAKRFKSSVEAIVSHAPNGLSAGDELVVGQEIMIPGGVKPAPSRRTYSLTRGSQRASVTAGVVFVMPVSGTFTQGYHKRHPAIDIGAPKGTPVYAADSGKVIFAGWHPAGYGYAVEIEHPSGYTTLYAHLSWYAPDAGQTVKRGELIGGVGSTYGSGGWSTGPHLHFEVIKNGVKLNPCRFLACP